MKKYELMYRTIIDTRERREIANESINELIDKIKLRLIGSDESIMDKYDLDIEFYDYGSIDLYTILSLIYDDVIIKRNILFNYIKTTHDIVEVTFRSNKIKDSENDPVDHYVNVEISYDPYVLEEDKLDKNGEKEFLFNIYVSTLDEDPLIFIYTRKNN